MDLEHLNKTQIILLTLFTSFVTSIATGIVTVSLMNQAPVQVAATVNHIIERTIQQVAAPVQTTPQTLKTVVVTQDDQVTKSIAAVQKSIIRIVATSAPELLVARGIVLDSAGAAITDRGSLDPDTQYEAILPSGARVPLAIRSIATSSPTVIVDLKLGTTSSVVPAAFSDPSKLQLGQTVIRIGGTGADTVAEGVIAALPQGSDPKAPAMLQASVSSATPGSVLFDLSGGVIGIITEDSSKVANDFYSMPDVFTKTATEAAPVVGTASTTTSVKASSLKIKR